MHQKQEISPWSIYDKEFNAEIITKPKSKERKSRFPKIDKPDKHRDKAPPIST